MSYLYIVERFLVQFEGLKPMWYNDFQYVANTYVANVDDSYARFENSNKASEFSNLLDCQN